MNKVRNTTKQGITVVLFASLASSMQGLESKRPSVGALAVLWLPFSGSHPSLHKGFPSSTAAELFPSFLASNKLHKGRYSAPTCGLCPSIPSQVTPGWLPAVLWWDREAVPPLGSRVVAFAVVDSFVLQVGGTDARSGERVWWNLAPSSLLKKDIPDGRTGVGGTGST